jgi:hypothetical protein
MLLADKLLDKIIWVRFALFDPARQIGTFLFIWMAIYGLTFEFAAGRCFGSDDDLDLVPEQ